MKRGFTLIELLAVIVILAIIALIAVPIVLNIIEDSKKQSIQRSVDLYIDHVQKAISKEQMLNSNFNPNICKILENGNIKCEEKEIKIEMQGEKPTSGTIKFNNNKIIYSGVFLNDTLYTKEEDGKKNITEASMTTTGNDYKGYYADVDGNGTVDGVIYADLSQSSTPGAQWINSDGSYNYTAKTNLNEYTISKNKYNGNFGEKEIIRLKKNKNNPRFYVMALEDFRIGSFEVGNKQCGGADCPVGSYYWYKNATDKMSTWETDTSVDFGKGYSNTGKIIEIWNKNGTGEGSYSGATKDNHDIFEHIQTKYQEDWYIPSRGEWSAFADYLSDQIETLTTSNYNIKYGLSGWYWSSSQHYISSVWVIGLYEGYIYADYVAGNHFIRLSATF